MILTGIILLLSSCGGYAVYKHYKNKNEIKKKQEEKNAITRPAAPASLYNYRNYDRKYKEETTKKKDSDNSFGSDLVSFAAGAVVGSLFSSDSSSSSDSNSWDSGSSFGGDSGGGGSSSDF